MHGCRRTCASRARHVAVAVIAEERLVALPKLPLLLQIRQIANFSSLLPRKSGSEQATELSVTDIQKVTYCTAIWSWRSVVDARPWRTNGSLCEFQRA